ncbi:efflux transporter outer membrane subunit [Sphingomonas sp. PR090111-T3T-6A]|uniref:efflux transporter outer membrane subunit n=1 Tax=Sphingomonas sp. PR090111-T3T-6A TaxID=685778 RepID=UPI0003AAF07E|nr:efflux transporter outer membrane subunit [Sphingomonas sp. PR090111-T3T-6A]
MPLLALSGCALGPNFHHEEPKPQLAAIQVSLPSASRTTDAAVPVAWWKAFGDPVLSTLEERAVAGDLNLRIASVRVARGRAALRIAGASLLPTANAATSYMRERASEKGIMGLAGATPPGPTAANGADPFGTASLGKTSGAADYDLFQMGFDTSWEIDLWGKARREREAARADAAGAVYEREAARVSLTAEVARIYVGLRGAEARLAVLRSNRETVARGLAIARAREDQGAASRYDAATATAQLATIDSQIPAIEREADASRNALAFLVGEAPHALDALLNQPGASIPALPQELPVGLSSDLARRRPDIAAAEASLHAATARIGAAKADFYPSLDLVGSFGTQSLRLADLPEWGSRQFILGPVLHLPIFEGGRLKGRLDLTRADQQEAAIRYQQTVLRAWHEVDDALTALRSEQQRMQASLRAVEASRTAVHVAERRYREGASGYLDVLIAERSLLSNEAELVSTRAASATAMVALYKALGGGWTPMTVGGGA